MKSEQPNSPLRRRTLGFAFRVLDFEAQFCGFLQHCGLQLSVLIVGSLQLADAVHGFSVAL